jgi:hypothetical protein
MGPGMGKEVFRFTGKVPIAGKGMTVEELLCSTFILSMVTAPVLGTLSMLF